MLQGRMISELQKWTETVMASFEVYPSILLEGLEKKSREN
jgi:hypothetical protein